MKNVYQLERERKNVLLDMNQEEIESYFKNLIKKEFDLVPKITDEGTIKEFDVLEHEKLKKNLHDSLNILEPKWNNLRVYTMQIIEDEWIDKYKDSLAKFELNQLKNNDEKRLIYIMNDFLRLEKALDSLIHHFNIWLLINHYMMFDFIGVLEIANVPDKQMKKIIKTLRKNSFYYDDPKYYDNRLNSYFNELIVRSVKEVEEAIQGFKKYKVEKEYSKEELEEMKKENPDQLEAIESYEEFYKYYSLGWFFVDYYEYFKENPFKEANEFLIKNLIYDETGLYLEGTNTDIKEELKASGNEEALKLFEDMIENFSVNLKYDFNDFKIIVPEEDHDENSSEKEEGVESDEKH